MPAPQPAPVIFPLQGRRIWVAGHRGMVGAALLRRLAAVECEVLTVGRDAVDLRRQADAEAWLAANKPDVAVVAAATVGGILANATRPADFLYDNLAIETNIIHGAWRTGVKKLLFLGSSCIYPKLAPQPLREDALLTGPLEETNEWYAIAKIAGIKLAQAYRKQHGCDFISAMPTNLYGAGDNYDPASSHVAAALMVKIHQAKAAGAEEIVIWGSGTPRREFLLVDDLADALVFLLERYSAHEHVNVGTGSDVTILELAGLLSKVIGWRGRFVHDRTKPDGTPRKVMDVSRLAALGWRAETGLEEGLSRAYAWYAAHVAEKS